MAILYNDPTEGWVSTFCAPGVDEAAEAKKVVPAGMEYWIVPDSALTDVVIPDNLTDAEYDALYAQTCADAVANLTPKVA